MALPDTVDAIEVVWLVLTGEALLASLRSLSDMRKKRSYVMQLIGEAAGSMMERAALEQARSNVDTEIGRAFAQAVLFLIAVPALWLQDENLALLEQLKNPSVDLLFFLIILLRFNTWRLVQARKRIETILSTDNGNGTPPVAPGV